ncbi:WD40 repeat domain-containing protein [Kitasatospora phosalacinea]|uniref:WD40 repeat domain-containing protein n=1 Tax=Kitasatospora phosalacinea TaxID=2065 RepID=UPI00365234AA
MPDPADFPPPAQHLRIRAASGTVAARAVLNALEGGRPIRLEPVSRHTSGSKLVSFSSDGSLIATTGRDGHTRVVDTVLRTLVAHHPSEPLDTSLRNLLAHTPDKLRTHITAAAFCPAPRSTLLAVVEHRRVIILWDPLAEETVRVGYTEGTYGITFSPDGRQLAAASRDGNIDIWNTASRTHAARCALRPGHTSLAFHPDGNLLAIANPHTDVQLVLTDDGACTDFPDTSIGNGRAVAYSPDGTRLALTGDNGVHLWNTRSRRQVSTLAEGPHPAVSSGLAFSPDGALLASTSDSGAVHLWDTATDRLLATLTGHTEASTNVAFSPDGSLLAATGKDGTVQLWTTPTG